MFRHDVLHFQMWCRIYVLHLTSTIQYTCIIILNFLKMETLFSYLSLEFSLGARVHTQHWWLEQVVWKFYGVFCSLLWSKHRKSREKFDCWPEQSVLSAKRCYVASGKQLTIYAVTLVLNQLIGSDRANQLPLVPRAISVRSTLQNDEGLQWSLMILIWNMLD